MAQKVGYTFNINLEREIAEQFSPDKLKEARLKSVESMGVVWSDETKRLTQEEDHIDTSLYINSIGYLSNYPDTNKSGNGKKAATEDDVIHEIEDSRTETKLRIGSAVSYAEDLEKRFALMARGLDMAEPRMKTVSDFQIKKVLGLK